MQTIHEATRREEDSVTQRTIRRETLAQQVTQGLLQMITDQGLGPGDELSSEGDLAGDFGVSKPVVREAVRALEAVGVLEVANGRRAVVTSVKAAPLQGFFQWAAYIDQDAQVELAELRQGVETQSAALAARRATDFELVEMRGLIDDMTATKDDAEAFVRLDTRLHLAVAVASHNKLLHYLVESISAPIQQAIRDGARRKWPQERERIIQLHANIVDALERRDPIAAQAMMAEHFARAIGHSALDRPASD